MRGQAYSLITLLVAVPLFLFLAFSLTAFQRQQTTIAQSVSIDQMRITERSVEDDFQKGVGISATRAFITATDHVVTNGSFLDSTITRVAELMFFGTLYGQPKALMQNNTLADWQTKILNVSTGYPISLSFVAPSLTNITGTLIYGSLDIIVEVRDAFSTAAYYRRATKPVIVPMEGYDDPLHILSTNGLVKRSYNTSPYTYYALKILVGSASGGNCTGEVTLDNTTPSASKILVTQNAAGITGFLGVVSEGTAAPGISCFIVGAQNAVAIVNQTINSTGFRNITLDNKTRGVWHMPIADEIYNRRYHIGVGPNVMERLQGNITGSNYSLLTGLESFVYIPDLISHGVSVKANQSIVDFFYFSPGTVPGSHLRPFPSWVLINYDFYTYYNFSEMID